MFFQKTFEIPSSDFCLICTIIALEYGAVFIEPLNELDVLFLVYFHLVG